MHTDQRGRFFGLLHTCSVNPGEENVKTDRVFVSPYFVPPEVDSKGLFTFVSLPHFVRGLTEKPHNLNNRWFNALSEAVTDVDVATLVFQGEQHNYCICSGINKGDNFHVAMLSHDITKR